MLNRFALLLICCAFGACTAVDVTTTGQSTLGGQVEFYLGGGFSGVRQSLMIDDTGRIVAEDDKRGKVARGQLDSVRMAELREAFMEIDSGAGTRPQQLDIRCADCFQYSIKATIRGTHHHVIVDSASLQDSPYSKAVQTLSQIMREILSSQRM